MGNTGWQIATINDFDGDGIIEYAISSIYSDDLASDTGSIILLPKSMLLDETLDVSTLQNFTEHNQKNMQDTPLSMLETSMEMVKPIF